MKKSIKRMQSNLLGLLSVRFLSNQKILILLASLLSGVSAYASEFEVDGIYYNVSTNPKELIVTFSDSKYTGSVNIPQYIEKDGKSYVVTSIGPRAFKECFGLTSVTIPGSVTTIGDEAFYDCNRLVSVSMTTPNSVTSIGISAFDHTAFYNDDSNWENGVLYLDNHLIRAKSDQVTDNYTIKDGTLTVASQAFYECNGLISVTIPNSVITIGKKTFYGCSSLSTVTIPNSLTYIGYSAFDKTALYDDNSNWENGVLYLGNHLIRAKSDQVTGDYTIKDGTLTVSDYAFSDCVGLTSVTIPNSVTSIGRYAFYYCTGLTSMIIPNSVTSIAEDAFYSCTSLSSVNIPSTVTSISDNTFFNCCNLTSIDIPNRVTFIGCGAFGYCEKINSITIPNSVTAIGTHAFIGCRELSSVTVKNGNPSNITLGKNVFKEGFFATLYVPRGSINLYVKADQWSNFQYIREFITVINIEDGQPYTETTEQQDVDINYIRTFIPDIWQPLYVPFNMSYDEWNDYGQVAELSCVHAYEDGRTTIEFVTVNSGELLPNVPYVFLPNTGDEIIFTCTNKTLKAAPAENTKYIMCSSPRYTFKIYGNYQSVSGSTLATYGDSQFNGAYVMTTDNKFQHCSPSATLKPYRFYITREKSANGYWGAPARQNASLTDNDDDDVIYFMVDGKVCGIADIVIDTDGSEVIYDLMGREVKNPSNGIYIQNGKKIRIY